jgi:hypothetical protein
MPGIDTMPFRGRPVNTQTLPGSLAEQKYRASAEYLDWTSENSGRRDSRPGLHDLTYRGGKTIPNLTFTNFYVGGDAWEPSDIESIDRALAAAMCEPRLNNVLAQYFNTVPTSRFVQSQKIDGSITSQFSKDDAEEVIRKLEIEGKLSGFDLNCTAINLMVPRGVVISVGESTSRDGLGGYHGSVQVADETIYYAVAVYSETSEGQTNGIPVFDDSWKNVVATAYHTLNEIRTDPDIQKGIDTGEDSLLGWLSISGHELGDFLWLSSLNEAFQEVPVVRIRGRAGRQFSPYRKSLPHLRSSQNVPGLLPLRARIVSSRIRRRNVSHAAGASSLRRAALCLSGDESPKH